MDADGSRLTCREVMVDGAAVEGGVPNAPEPPPPLVVVVVADFVAMVAMEMCGF